MSYHTAISTANLQQINTVFNEMYKKRGAGEGGLTRLQWSDLAQVIIPKKPLQETAYLASC